MKLKVNEAHLMSFISVPVLPKKLEAHMWLDGPYIMKTFCSLSHSKKKKGKIKILSPFLSVLLSRKVALFPPCLLPKDEEMHLLLACCCEIMCYHRRTSTFCISWSKRC